MAKTLKSGLIPSVGYMRTSSAVNSGPDKDSEKRQKAAIQGFAAANGYEVVDWYYDMAVSGADPVASRPGFAEMLQRLLSNGVKSILTESPDRFARDLSVQIAGHDMLKALGIALIPASAPDFFTEETPTAVLVRQVLGAISQFDKATIVAKLAASRKRIRESTGKCEGRKTILQRDPAACGLAITMAAVRKRKPSLRTIGLQLAAEGHRDASGAPYTAKVVRAMLDTPRIKTIALQ